MSNVRYVSKNEQEVCHQFLIFLVECGACELANNESEKGCHLSYDLCSCCTEDLQSYTASMMLHRCGGPIGSHLRHCLCNL